MDTLFLIGVAIILLFASAIGFGAPFLPTLNNRVKDALDLLDLRPGQSMLELGSGDGRMLREAAKRGIYSVGYEINPLLVVYSKFTCFRQRKFITIRMRNYWREELPACDGVYVFLLQPYMSKLQKKLAQSAFDQKKPYIKLVSFSFFIEGLKPKKDNMGMLLYHIAAKDSR